MNAPQTDWLSEAPYPKDIRHDLFRGTGAVTVWDLLAGRPLDPFTAVLACELAPSSSVGRHLQERDEEVILCAQGSGEIALDGRPRAFTPGEVALLPLGSTMALRNLSDSEPLRYFIIKANASLADTQSA